MDLLRDCQIIEYCQSTTEERDLEFQRAVDNLFKPIYQMPVFELCHALHLLVKHHRVSPSSFRQSYADFSEKHIEAGEWFVHVPEETTDDNLSKIREMTDKLPKDGTSPCGEPEIYWGHNKHLIYRLQSAHAIQELQGWWKANPPEIKRESPSPSIVPTQDLVMDTNNLIELLNILPLDSFLSVADVSFPPSARIAEYTQRKFRAIIRAHGAAGKFIIPLSVLEETERVVKHSHPVWKYQNARNVLDAILNDRDNLLWNIFSFESMNQEIFEYFLYLYEQLELANVDFDTFDDFGDLLVLAHGIYHGCKIASNEWVDGDPDIWDIVKVIFPFLVLEGE